MFVQFENEKEEKIIVAFADPQCPETFPFQGEVEEDDERYIAFLVSMQPQAAIEDPQEKLIAFLNSNPDVAKLLSK